MSKAVNNNVHSFLESLDCWQTINLFTVLKLGQNDVSFSEARNQAIQNLNDTKGLEFLLEEALNSPNVKQ